MYRTVNFHDFNNKIKCELRNRNKEFTYLEANFQGLVLPISACTLVLVIEMELGLG